MIRYIKPVRAIVKPLFSAQSWSNFGDYVGLGKSSRNETITNAGSLAFFINGRASHVAQTSLYGYLRTRAGTRYPELFENPDMLTSINIAKWQLWLACTSDLCVFSGQWISQSELLSRQQLEQLMTSTCSRLLQEHGLPEEAGPDFQPARDEVLNRVSCHVWARQLNDDEVFCKSPEALVYWAPIADELKIRDQEIVVNSVRFRWIEVRRAVRRQIDIPAVVESINLNPAC